MEKEKIRLGIISDTHGLLRPEVVEVLKTCTHIIHAGDFDNPEVLNALQPLGFIYAVRGNNDFYWAKHLKKILHFTIGGIKFLLVHDLMDAGRHVKDAQVVIHGHSHSYAEEYYDGRLYLNPGSCGHRRFYTQPSMAVMTIENGHYQVEKITL